MGLSQRGLHALINKDLELSDLVPTVAEKLLLSLNTPVSRVVCAALKAGDVETVVHTSVNPRHYIDAESYYDDAQSVALLRKYPFKGREELCASAAERTFLEGEQACLDTNELFRIWDRGECELAHGAGGILMSARRKIQMILGDFSVERWLDGCCFGPGSVIGVPGTSDYSKLSSELSYTPALAPYVRAFFGEHSAWYRGVANGRTSPEVKTSRQYPGGVYAQVPKNAKTNRNTESQPSLNAYLQSGIGSEIRRLLKQRARINLNDQTTNQRLAREGSLTGWWATMDLSNASDTIATELVRYLVPADWFHAMDLVRTHVISFLGKSRPLARFSSMGNGFTFELESLIYWALAKSTCEANGYTGRISVYGDDIIVPSQYFDHVASVLNVCGFTVNFEKSFKDGPFRESCGADWFNGCAVRPFYITKVPTDVASLISLANGIKRAAGRHMLGFGYDKRFASAWFHTVRRIPLVVRRRLAFGFTDTDEFVLCGKQRDGLGVKFIAKSNRSLNWYPALATALYRIHRRSRATAPMINEVRASLISRGEPVYGWSDVGAPLPIPITSVVSKHFSDRRPAHLSFHVSDYRRDCGEWALGKHSAGILSGRVASWW